MTPQEQIDYIHNLHKEQNVVEMILCIAEYGYSGFFKHYDEYLRLMYRKSVAELYWDEAFDWYTSSYYSQLWRGLEMQPYGQFDEKKYRKNRHKNFDEIRDREPAKVSGKLSDLLKL